MGSSSTDIANSQLFQKQWGPLDPRTIRTAIDIMNRRNQRWYEDHKLPEKRISILYKEQVDRYLHLLKAQYTLFYSYMTLDHPKWKEGMRDQSGLKLQCSGMIERTIYHLCDVLGVKGRSVDDQALEQTLNKLLREVSDYQAKQQELEEQRMKQKIRPL